MKQSDYFEELLQILHEQKISFEELDAILITAGESQKVVPLFSTLNTYLEFVENSHESALIINPEGRIIYTNRSLPKLMESEYSNIIRQNYGILFYEDGKQQIKKFIEDNNETEKGFETLLKGNKKKIPVWVSLTKRRFEQREYISILITDLTEQKTLNQITRTSQLLKNVLNNSKDMVIITDTDFNILEYSQNIKSGADESHTGKNLSTVIEIYSVEDLNRIFTLEELIKLKGKEILVDVRWYKRLQLSRCNLTVATLTDINKNLQGYLFTFEDISEIQKQLNQIQTILSTMQDGYILADDEGNILDVNESYCRMIGYSKDELLKMNIINLEANFSENEVREKIKLFKQNESTRFVTRHRHKNGNLIILDVNIVGSTEHNKTLIAAFCKDITEQESLQKILRESEQRYRGIFQNSPLGIMIIKENKIWLINEAGKKILKVDNEIKILNSTLLDLIPKEYHDSIGTQINSILNGEKETLSGLKTRVRRYDNFLIDVEFSLNKIEIMGQPSIQLVFQDITHREREFKIEHLYKEIALGVYHSNTLQDLAKIIETHLKKILSIDSLLMALYNKQTETLEIIHSSVDEGIGDTFSIKGTLSEQVISLKLSLLLREEDIDNLIDLGKYRLKGKPTKCWLGVPLIYKSEPIGIIILQHFSNASAFTEKDRELMESIAHHLTIAIREKLFQQELIKFQHIINQNPLSIMITDPEGNLSYVNPYFEDLTGYSANEVLNKNPRFLQSGLTPSTVYDELWATITEGKTWRGKFINKKKDGTIFHEEAIIFPLQNEHGEAINYIGIKKDITSQIEAENRLFQNQKMEAMGQLVSGVAHDFNNMLTAITGYSELLLNKIDSQHPFYKALSTILDASQSASDLTKQLLAFSRKQTIEPRVLDVNSSFSKWFKIYRRLVPEDIEVKFIPCKEDIKIMADPVQLEQVLLNLIVNARDAIVDKTDNRNKRITIEVVKVEVDHITAESHPPLKPGLSACITISDTGVGIPPELIDRIFEPFFTTKPKGKGTGMGLSTVYGIVSQHKGTINVYSEYGVGTTFKIYWPVMSDAESAILQKDEELIELPQKELVIMLLEDDPKVREFAKIAMEEYDIQVIDFNSPHEALNHLKSSNITYDLVITDLIMPEMSGYDFIQEAKKITPDIKYILTTGYSENHISEKEKFPEDVIFLNKPFTPRMLLMKIKEALHIKE